MLPIALFLITVAGLGVVFQVLERLPGDRPRALYRSGATAAAVVIGMGLLLSLARTPAGRLREDLVWPGLVTFCLLGIGANLLYAWLRGRPALRESRAGMVAAFTASTTLLAFVIFFAIMVLAPSS